MIEFGGNVVALPNTNLPFIAHFRAILIEFDICRKLFYFKYEFKKLMRIITNGIYWFFFLLLSKLAYLNKKTRVFYFSGKMKRKTFT